MYHMKKGGSKSPKQQAAIAMAMKAAGKKPKMQGGGEKPKPTYKNLKMGVRNEQYQMTGQYKDVTPSSRDSANYRRGYERGLKGGKEFPNEGNVEKMGRWEGQNVKPKQKKMAMGGSLKDVDASKNPGLAKLPTAVRNKMGYKKMGGPAKMQMGGGSSSSNTPFPKSSPAPISPAARSAAASVAKTATSSSPSSSSTSSKMKGVTSPEQSNILSKVPAAGAVKTSKQKERTDDGNYARITKTRVTPAGTSSTTKMRRTVQGVLRGAPRVPNYKKGGMVGKSKKK